MDTVKMIDFQDKDFRKYQIFPAILVLTEGSTITGIKYGIL